MVSVRELRVEHGLDGESWPLVDALAGDPALWLPEPATRTPEGRWTIRVGTAGMRHAVDVEVGTPWSLPDRWSRTLTWAAGAAGPFPLPSFQGAIELPLGGEPLLALVGAYVPPARTLGSLADQVVMHHVAVATMRRLLQDIGRRLASIRASGPVS